MAERNTGPNSGNQEKARKNTVRAARSASSAPRAFYLVLAGLAVIGVGALAYFVTRPKAAPIEVAALTDTTNAGPPHGYLMGNPNAPVKITEFGDFECPACARFATLTEPDLRQRLIQTGQVAFTFYDFPLNVHRNTQAASNAAACADEQGRFWEMHDRLYDTQDTWNGEQTDNPGPIFRSLATAMGLNVDQWQQCFDTRKYQSRIAANYAEGERHNVPSTPSFIIGNKLYPGAMSYDEVKAIVDSLRPSAAPAAK